MEIEDTEEQHTINFVQKKINFSDILKSVTCQSQKDEESYLVIN